MDSNDEVGTSARSRHRGDFERITRPVFEGFESLLEQVQLLGRQHVNLERKLAFAQAEYRELAAKYAPSHPTAVETPSDTDQVGNDMGKDLGASGLDMTWTHVRLRHDRREDEEAVQKILCGKMAWDAMFRDTDRKARGLSTDSTDIRGPLATRENSERRPSSCNSNLEQDFTTPGIEGNLQCPFAHMTGDKPGSHPSSGPQTSTIRHSGGLPTPPHGEGSHTLVDPIEAELHGDAFSSPPPSVTGSTSKCPIRFLDQHSPEEVAKYFETHKHEIPRSHEICVKRYQSNAESIRQLDAKYGSLVSMIQGLGIKHKPLLPADNAADMGTGEVRSVDRVGKWAEAVSERLEGGEDGSVEQEQEDREGHFDRPLKEVRVGESPSRPWGISVPATGDSAMAAFSSRRDHTVDEHQSNREPLPEPTATKITGQCPFGFNKENSSQLPEIQLPTYVAPDPAPSSSRDQPQLSSESGGQQQQPTSAPQMIFTGPVFIGYAPEQAMAFLQQLGTGPKPTA